jgi:predicted NBD/HSP70 family sugar kinase
VLDGYAHGQRSPGGWGKTGGRFDASYLWAHVHGGVAVCGGDLCRCRAHAHATDPMKALARLPLILPRPGRGRLTMGRDVVETNSGASALLGCHPANRPGTARAAGIFLPSTSAAPIFAVRSSPEGAVSDHQRIDTPISSPDTGPVVEFIRRAAADAGAAAVVIGLPGRIDYERGCLDHAPNLPAGWVNALDESDLSDAVGLPVSVANLTNDADLAAVGEAWLGAGRPWSDVVYVTVSTGAGAGVVLGDQLVHGRRCLAERGHCLVDQTAPRIEADATSVEDVASGTALGRRAVRAGLVAVALGSSPRSGPETLVWRGLGGPGARGWLGGGEPDVDIHVASGSGGGRRAWSGRCHAA